MNRRNFLKLFGLSALPVGLLPAPAQTESYVTDIRNIRVTTRFRDKFLVIVDNSAEPALEDFEGYFGSTHEEWIKWNFRDTNNNFYLPEHTNFFEVSEKSVITIVSPTVNKVTFSPTPDKVYGDFMMQVDVDYVRHSETPTGTLAAIQTPHRLS